MTTPDSSLDVQFSADADLRDFPQLEVTSTVAGIVKVVVPGQGSVAEIQATAGKKYKIMVPDEALTEGVTVQLLDGNEEPLRTVSPDSSEYKARMKAFEEQSQRDAADEPLAA